MKCNDNKLSDLCQGGILTVWKYVYLRALFRGFEPPFIWPGDIEKTKNEPLKML